MRSPKGGLAGLGKKAETCLCSCVEDKTWGKGRHEVYSEQAESVGAEGKGADLGMVRGSNLFLISSIGQAEGTE